MPELSELEALMKISDLQIRKFLKEQISMKRQIQEKLEQEDISVHDETELRSALKMIDNNIQSIRMEGIM